MKIIYLLVLFVLLSVKKIESFKCCVPDQWSGTALSMGSDGKLFKKNYYYDATQMTVRIDSIYSTKSESTFSYYTNMTTTGREWVYNRFENTCYETGPDYWNYQCFGEEYGLPFVKTDSGENIFSNPSNGITVVTTSDTCLPISITNKYAGLHFKFFNTKDYIEDPSVFNKPSVCK
ncbi:hypothetical protein DICPUDRAFT_99798 [Dictyostelium purpureum]|uniref:Uncharacterized protein n=1 Tax=Dictyostelium purpureum TaxID=5786 RepID=F1A2P1_DICPU|nr:uncharacterized protein DICPUDRAFT_99798 [Dictyostelium purpureum]EGC29546.1 hypothetical protein DICPUDRAFT_99798 [Dictyostelium purpureum]|eukprot:XP_003293936.1 hypothetical protein DICPUDRAFT_99798 [Dictyostelium purpureum]